MGNMSVPDILPPSPPTTSHRHRVPLFHLSKPATSTPDDSPASLLPSSSGNGSRRRVEFSPWTNILEAPLSDQSSNAGELKALPRSKDCQSVAKSILKPQSEQEILIESEGSNDLVSTVTMDSLVQALGNNDKTTSVDAYQCLAQLIKIYEEVPDDVDTRGNVANIVRYIRRDLTVQEHGPTTPVDINLVTQALKVTVILVWSEQFSPLLPDEFKIFITDRAITVLTEHTAPKVVVVHYMHVLATQSFRPALFNSGSRTVKLLEALRDITNHVQGKGAMTERLLIYQKLIEQAKHIMKTKAGLWIKEVLFGLCSNVKEIREKAISVCTRAVATFPASAAISQAARDALCEESKDRILNASLTQRLDRMIAAKDEAIQVPQIWALVMLLCNSAEMRIDNWTYIRDWLRVIQRCFNCSDINVRVQAFPAWNRFIYIIRPHEATEAMMAMLAKPIAVQIERTGANASSKGSRPAAISSYCTLYYAFRPAASHKQYTKAWNEYIVKVATSQFLSKSTANADLCCRVLMALLWRDASASRIWNEARAQENKPMDPDELPSIDCKWIRSKSTAILDMFRLLFRHSAWGPSIQHSDQAFVAKAWRAFLRAVREASSKEIKPSAETKKTLLGIITFINEICRDEPEDAARSRVNLQRAQLSCKIAISELGGTSLLEVLESIDDWKYPEAVFSGILAHAADASCAACDRYGKPGSASHNEPSHPPLQMMLRKALGLLNNQVERQYQSAQPVSAALSAVLEICAKTLQSAPKCHKLDCLRCLQRSLALVLKDDLCLTSSPHGNVDIDTAWNRLTVAVVGSLTQISLAEFETLDTLLASLISSHNEFAPSTLLKAWSNTRWYEQNGCYGKLFTNAIEQMQTQTFVNLPGLVIPNQCGSGHSQVEHMTFLAAPNNNEHTSVEESQELQVEENKQPLLANELIREDNENDAAEDKPKKQSPQPSPRGRKHDDSQLSFTPIGCSPTNPEDVNSQMLTDKQKEVRNRQRSEQAVTFADIRSSPGAVTNRSSRATSIDCEMARKIAASENRPTTPTLAKHTNTMDDQDMPSPTPKARHRTLRIEEIEIPSSPPSTTVNRNVDMNIINLIVTAEDGANAHEPIVEDMNHGYEEGIDLQVGSSSGKPELSRRLRSSTKAETGDSQKNAVILDTVMQNSDKSTSQLQSAGQRLPRDDWRVLGELETAKVDATTVANEKVDNSGTSQLSEDLDLHVVEENGTVSEELQDQSANATRTRKRKRSGIGYVHISGQSSRKRRSVGKKSSAMEDTSMNESEEQQEQGSLSVVEHAEDATSVEKPIESNAVSEIMQITSDSQTSAIQSGSQSRRLRSRKAKRGSHHTKVECQNVRSDPGTPQPANVSLGEQETEFNVVFHTPTTQKAIQTKGVGLTEVDATTKTSELHCVSHEHIDIMKALKAALNGLEQSELAQEIDLKALDDLCFKIRFKAQEIVQKRDQA